MNENKYNLIKFITFCISFVMCLTLITCSYYWSNTLIKIPYEYTVKIEMDNNTLEAIKSINYTALNNYKSEYTKELCFNTDDFGKLSYNPNNDYWYNNSYGIEIEVKQ